MIKTIGTYEAQTHWSEVLQEVKNGESYIITDHGEPVAELVPAQSQTRKERSIFAAKDLLLFMDRRHAVEVDIKAAIEEGRD